MQLSFFEGCIASKYDRNGKLPVGIDMVTFRLVIVGESSGGRRGDKGAASRTAGSITHAF